ncbi:MAG: S8 family serine peptidase, partial [Gaiellaceae bacterium]
MKLAARLSTDEQNALIARDGGTETKAIAPLRLHVIEVDDADADATLANYRGDDQVVSAELDKTRAVGTTPGDFAYGNQWSLPKIGWDNLYGSVHALSTATVAVLDTGVDASHEDLQHQLAAGTSILDGSAGTTDANGHGTEMAGIVAAAAGNGKGIAGVGYSGVNVMPVTVLGRDGTGQDSDVVAGVVYAVQQGADVILMSFSNPGFSQSLQDAIDYAWDNNVVVVAATGNDGSDVATFPAGDRGVIGVSNTDSLDALNPTSNYGDDTFLAAPGTAISTTSPGDSYVSVTGTSAAAAVVAGAAGLMRAASVLASNGVIASRLAKTADPAGTAAQTGNGRLNLERAMGDESTDSIEPAGAGPAGGGGPFVGPYTVASATYTSLFPLDATSYTTATYNAGNGTGAADIGAVVSWGQSTGAHTVSFSIKRNSDNT